MTAVRCQWPVWVQAVTLGVTVVLIGLTIVQLITSWRQGKASDRRIAVMLADTERLERMRDATRAMMATMPQPPAPHVPGGGVDDGR